MKLPPLLSLGIATALCGFALNALACPPHSGGPRHGAGPGADLAPMMMPMPPHLPPPHLLKLSDAQEEKLFALMQAQMKAGHEAMRAAGKTMDALREVARTEPFNAEKARTLASEHGRQLAELIFLHAQGEARMREILTPEQRQRIDALSGPDGDGKSCRGEAP